MRAVPSLSLSALLFLFYIFAPHGALALDFATHERIQAQLDSIRDRGRLPGVTLAILSNKGTLQTFATGFSELANQTPLHSDAVMPIGSIGKQFFAATALALEHEGRVSLDVPIEQWFREDEWFSHVQNAHQLTLRLLLMHQGGIGDHRKSPKFAAAIREAFARVPFDPNFRIPPEKIVEMLRDEPPLFAPGKGFSYSETGYLLAGLALERACKCRYYDELERIFLRPLKLIHTRPATTRAVPGLANGYTSDELVALGFPRETLESGKLRFSPATEWTGGGLYSNVEDLVRWSEALYEGRALRGKYLGELLAQDEGGKTDREAYGLGVRRTTTPLGVAYGHAGEFPGYVSILLYFPAFRSSVAMQTNTSLTDAKFMISAAVEVMRIASGQ